jgi:adenylate cyclase
VSDGPDVSPAPAATDGREAWRQVLRALGTPEDELEAADTDEQLLLLVTEHALGGGPARYTLAEASAIAGFDEDFTRRLFRALGVPDAEHDDRAFTDEDVDALRLVGVIRQRNLVNDEVLLQLTRVTGSSLARIAEAMVGAAIERVRHGGELGGPETGGFTELGRILEVLWRRQMRNAARRRMALHADASRTVIVGFADLVGFTALSQQLDDVELAHVVERFESTAYDIIGARGGRVVKMIGDEVMFAVDDVAIAAEIALDLSESYHDDESLSDVRVGMASGPVLEREGDLFGPTVNLASRIVGIAYAGSVVVSDDVRDALVDQPGLGWRSMRTRYLKDIGRVALWVMRRATDDFDREGVLERGRRRRNAMRNRVAELLQAQESRDRGVVDPGT